MVLASALGVRLIDVAIEYAVKRHTRHDGCKPFDVNPGGTEAWHQPNLDSRHTPLTTFSPPPKRRGLRRL